MNHQMATDAANAAAQQQFLAGMASAQETMNNANNNQPTSTGNGARADERNCANLRGRKV